MIFVKTSLKIKIWIFLHSKFKKFRFRCAVELCEFVVVVDVVVVVDFEVAGAEPRSHKRLEFQCENTAAASNSRSQAVAAT